MPTCKNEHPEAKKRLGMHTQKKIFLRRGLECVYGGREEWGLVRRLGAAVAESRPKKNETSTKIRWLT